MELFLRHGAGEERNPKPDLRTDDFLERYPNVTEPEVNALRQNLRYLENEVRNQTHLSSASHLNKHIEIVRKTDLFNSNRYLCQYPSVATDFIDQALDYLQIGYREGRNPSPEFDSNFYLAEYPDVACSGLNPLVHYLLFGRDEGRLPKAGRALTLGAKALGGLFKIC